MTKKQIFRLLSLLFILSSLLCLFGCGSDSENILRMEVTQITRQEEDIAITVDYNNKTGGNVSFGWAGSCEYVVYTDEGEYYYSARFNEDMKRGKGSFTETFKDCEGEVERIVISDLRKLKDNGLPGMRIKNAQIYDAEDAGAAEISFALFDAYPWLVWVLVGAALFVAAAAAVLFYLLKALTPKK